VKFSQYTFNDKYLKTDLRSESKMLEKMRSILEEQLNCEGDIITEETSFKDDLGADSLDLFELVMALEEEYGIEIPAEELTELETVGSVIEYLKAKGVEV
jgi:acyl carrier protein